MAEIPQQKFEHSALEKDIERLSKEIQERKAAAEKPEIPEREIVKAAIGERIRAQVAPVAPKIQPSLILPEYLRQEPAEIKLKVEKLIDVAFHKGIDVSIEEAKKCGPFILDAFHDALTVKLYDELKARKIL